MKLGEGVHGKGGSLGDADAWVLAAKSHVLNLLERHLAVVHPELEARLSEQGIPNGARRLRFDPHILSEAVRDLRALGLIQERTHLTKGRRPIDVLTPADTHRRETSVQKAVRRKGMLYARFRTLADTAGEAGEAVVRNSLALAGPSTVPIAPDFGEVTSLLGTTLYGAFDSGAWQVTVSPATGHPSTVAVPIEVKNRRQVLYPIHKEVHQLLAKAAAVQDENPDFPIMPVLICRRAHARLFWMARDLGFRVHATNRQFVHVPKNLDARRIEEVRTELGLSDLTVVPRDRASMPTIREFFTDTMPKSSTSAPSRWAVTASVMRPYSDELRKASLDPATRQDWLRDVRQELEIAMQDAGFTDEFRTWSLPDLEE